jgi:hypothetical protein
MLTTREAAFNAASLVVKHRKILDDLNFLENCQYFRRNWRKNVEITNRKITIL